MKEKLKQQLEQPLTLAYLSAVTLSMLDANARMVDDSENYLSTILGNAKLMMGVIVKEQLDQLKEYESMEDMGELGAAMGIPSASLMKETILEIVESQDQQFVDYKTEILNDINGTKESDEEE